MGKVVGTVLKVVGVVALTVVTGGTAGIAALSTLAAGTALGSAILITGSLALSVGSGLLAKDKAQKAAASARAEQIRAMVNPQAMANWVFGETATAVQIVYSEVFGSKKDQAALIYAGPAHPVDSYGQLYINDELVTFSGNNATGAWSGAVSRYTNLGSESQAALVIPGSTWPSDARGRGFAHFGLKWSLDHDKLKEGLPDRLTQVVKGVPVYDPRLDSTVGGSGTQRANDQTTWAYSNSISADAGANWALVCLHYILGWKNNGKLVYGREADPQDIDYASFITAANICDQIVDGIPRYHIGGIERIDGDHNRIMGALEATIGGKISKPGGMYHCWAPNDDLVATETISENDLIRDVGVNFQDARSIQNIFNVGQGQFIDPSALYQPAPYPEVIEASAVTDLGRERIMNYDTPYIQNEKRAQRVVLQQVRRSLFGRVWKLGVGPKYFRRKVFDIINLKIKETNLTNTFARITEKTTSPNGLIVFTLEEENSLIYDVTAPLGSLAARNIPPTFDGATNIPVTTLNVTAVSVTGTGGTASDALQVSYDDPGPLVNRTDIEYQVQGATNWQPAASKVLDAGIAIISPVESGTTYYVRVRHWTVFDVPSSWVTDFVTAGQAQVAGAIDFAKVTGVTKPEDNATVSDPYGASFNLLGSDAGPNRSILGTGYNYTGFGLGTGGKPIADLGLEVGDAISVSIEFYQTGVATHYAQLIFSDILGVNVGFYSASSAIENEWSSLSLTKVIPANALYLQVRATYDGGTPTSIDVRRAMLNRGPVALPYVAPYEDGADITNYTDARIKNDGRVPDNIHVGGFGDLRFTKNAVEGGSSNDGEIRFQGSKFYHPDGTTRTTRLNDARIPTPFEAAFVRKGIFYIIWTDEKPTTRFSGYYWDNDSVSTDEFFIAEYDWENKQWMAVDNLQSTWNFTPLDTDCVVAIGTKTLTSGGIGTLSSFLGANVNLPADGATVGATQGVDFFKPGGSIPYDSIEFENQLITLNTGGWLNNIGTTEIIQNAKINVDSGGAIQGIGTGAGKIVDNSDLAINSTGQLTYAGGTINLGAVTGAGLGVKALGFLDNADWSANIVGSAKPEDNATRQVNQGSYSGSTEYIKGDVVTSGGSSYEYINATPSTGNAPPNATYWALLAAQGSQGAAGNKFKFAYISSTSQPATPTGTTFPPAGWFDAPPGGSSSIWVVQVEFTGADVYVGPWSTPAQWANPGTTARSSSASISVPSTISSTSYISFGSVMALDLGPNGEHTVNYSLNFASVDGSPSTLYAKIQYRPAGGSWSDLTTEKSGVSGNNTEPSFVADTKVTAFSGSQASYEFRLVVRKVNSNANITVASAKASWTNA